MSDKQADVHVHDPIEYRFCPRCGGKLERRRLKPIEPERLVCRRCSFIFYLDPKVVAGTIFSIDDRVALLRRGVEPATGKWVYPGGYVDRGERVQDAAIRETQEECHLTVKLCSLLGVYSYSGSPVVIVTYVAEIKAGQLKAGDETLEAKTFAAADIPWDELAFPSTRDALEDYVRLYLSSKG
ncbi:MAG: NUDIX domain-containing protein [Candidatus Binatia bacterium]